MSTSVSVFIFFAVIQIISSQYKGPNIDPSIPKECYAPPPDVNLLQCCPLPNMNTLEELTACGVQTSIRGLPPSREERCKRKTCLLKNKGLLNENNTIIDEKLEAFLDIWSENQTHLEYGVKKAKDVCLRFTEITQEPFLIKRPDFCAADVLFECVPVNVIWNCKLREEYATCRKLKDHMDQCRQYVYKPPQI